MAVSVAAGHARGALAALLASSALGTPGAARAQNSSAAAPSVTLPAGPSATGDAGQNADIIVTATKRSERLQDVPISLQVLGNQSLEQHQVKALDDYTKLLPSVSTQSFGPGQSQLYFRGITSGADGLHIGPQPTSGTYVDEIPVTTIANSIDLHVYDIERVEALSGPQGTLFGASSEAGTLRIITNKPDPTKFSAGYDLEGNKFGRGGYGGVVNTFVNIPLSDRAAIRLVGFYEHDGGYIDNVPGTRTYDLGDKDPTTNVTIDNAKFTKKNFNEVDTYGGRIALKYDIDDNWVVTPQIIAQHQKTHGNFLYDPRVGDLEVHDFFPEENVDKWYQGALTIQGKLSNWDVTYAGSYLGRKTENRTDYSYYSVAYDSYLGSYATYFPTGDAAHPYIDPSQQQLLRDRYTKMSHELRVSSPTGERLRLTAGLFYERQSDRVKADYFITGLSGTPGNDLTYVTPIAGFGDDVFATRVLRVDRDYAAFGEAAFDIVPGVTLNGGIRGYIYHNTLAGFSGFAALDPVDATSDGSGETHKVNLTWKIDRNHMVYGTYSTGFRPGGGNRLAGYAPYKADTLNNYEVGFKTGWFDNRLHVNGALFYEEWNDFQLTYSPADANGVNITQNVGGAHSKGVEADANLRLGDLSLSGSGTYLKAYTTDEFCSTRACTPAHTRLPVQPRLKISGTVRYEIPIGSAAPFVQASVLHQSSTRSFLLEDQFQNIGTLSGFTTFDFSGGITLAQGIRLELFVQNAFDRRGQLSRNTACTPSLALCARNYRIYPVKPQLFGIRMGQKF